jgi:hypothetical protein
MSETQPSVEDILAGARQAELPLTRDEAAELVKGVGRMREMARSVRELLSETTEPAPVFAPQFREPQAR